MTSYTLRKGSSAKVRTDVVVIAVTSTAQGPVLAPGGEAVASAYGRALTPLLASLGFTGTRDEVAQVPTAKTLRAPLLLLVGIGSADVLGDATRTTDAVRRAAGVAARTVSNSASVALALPARDPAEVRAGAEGFELGRYAFTAYKSGPAKDEPGEVVLLSEIARSKAGAAALETALVVSSAVRTARDWVNTPAADLAPPAFADAVRAQAKASSGKLRVEVLDEEQLRERGFGGIIGVGRGSAQPPRLVTLSYRPRRATRHLVLVGKGITFDSGGLAIKTQLGMRTMKCDMGGAAAVLAATVAIAELGLPVRVTTFAPMAENMISGDATRPGDVLTMYGGTTVEVLNPDAEGRLVLADALVAAGEVGPDLLVDVATLTGAAETALGDRVSAIFGHDDAAVARVRAAGARVGEALWQLPISEEMPVKVRTYSKIADLMQHNVDVYGGALYAAAFLAEFVPDGVPWAHLDIAGTGFNRRGAYGHVPSGGTGVSVATLVELATELAEAQDS